MESQISYVRDYFLQKHLLLKDDWLKEVLNYLSTSKITGNILCKAVFDQWLYSNISESSDPIFVKPQGKVGFIRGHYIMQIKSVIDIGNSLWSQRRKDASTSENLSFFDTLVKDDLPSEVQYQQKSKRMLLFELTDGNQCIKAIEYRSLESLNVLIPPGAKVLLYGRIKIRNNILWLTDNNCQLLGGELDEVKADQSVAHQQSNASTSSIQLNVKKKDELKVINHKKPEVEEIQIVPETLGVDQKLLLDKVSTSNIDYLPLEPSEDSETEEIVFDTLNIVRDDFMSSSTVSTKSINESTNRNQSTNIVLDPHDEFLNPNLSTSKMSELISSPKPSNNKENEYKPIIMNGTVEASSSFYDDLEIDIKPCIKKELSPDLEILSPVPKKPRTSISTMKNTINNPILTKFKDVGIVKISDAVRKMKYSIGSKRSKFMAYMKEEIDPFHPEDNEWTMTIRIADDSHNGLKCFVAHELLCDLIGMTPAEAIAIKKCTNKAKKEEGKMRLESLHFQLKRLDLIFEVELFSAMRTTPKIVGLETLYDIITK